MKRQFLVFCLSFCLGPLMLVGQDSKVNLKAEADAIRAVIASDKIPYTDDCVQWAGYAKRPVKGRERPEPLPDSDFTKRKNVVATTKKIERLEVSASGDMAWDYEISHVEYDVDEPAKRHKSYDGGQLRVWKKVSGEWKVAARFYRPLGLPLQ